MYRNIDNFSEHHRVNVLKSYRYYLLSYLVTYYLNDFTRLRKFVPNLDEYQYSYPIDLLYQCFWDYFKMIYGKYTLPVN